jgi:two-component system, chemotaxis family, CheB/CheR fusion protein
MTHPLRVLVVDDNADAADSTAMLLDLLGYEARVAHDGASALADAAAFPPDVVLLDLGLRGEDGVEVGAQLLDALPDRPTLVALTGFPHLEGECRDAGFDHYFVKPADMRRLTRLLEGLAGRAAVPA